MPNSAEWGDWNPKALVLTDRYKAFAVVLAPPDFEGNVFLAAMRIWESSYPEEDEHYDEPSDEQIKAAFEASGWKYFHYFSLDRDQLSQGEQS